MPRFCTQCGAPNDDEAKFCRQCGATLSASAKPPSTPESAVVVPSDESRLLAEREAQATADAAQQQREQLEEAQRLREQQEQQEREAAERLAEQRAHEERERREQERLAATARLEDEIRARAQAARISPPPRKDDATGQAPLPNESPASGPLKAQPVKGSNAFLIGGIATVVIAFLLIGGGGLWWSMHQSRLAESNAAVAASSPAVAPSAPDSSAPTRPAHAASVVAPRPETAPAPKPVEAAPPVQPKAPAPTSATRQPVAEAPPAHSRPRQAQPETFAPAKPIARPQPAQQPAVQPPQAVAPQAEAPTPPKPQGRIEALRAGLAACETKGNFFSKQLCIQETRWKYCGAPLSSDPLWGKIPECPNSGQQQNNPY